MKEVVWIIGRGLLGSGIESHIRKNLPTTQIFSSAPFSWTDSPKLTVEFAAALGEFAEFLRQNGGRYRIFWTAGRGIMSSTEEDMQKETRCLAEFLELLKNNEGITTAEGIFGFSSSAGGVYAGSSDDIITETSAVSPLTAYGRGKVEQEKLVLDYSHPHCGVLLTRITNLYGPGQSRTKKQGLLTHIARCILTRRPIHIFVPFDTMRDYIHVRDAAADFIHASAFLNPGETVTKIIASEEPATIAMMIGLFRRISRHNPLVVTGTNELGAAYPHRMRFASKILTQARGAHRVSLLEGLAETFAHERLEYATSGMPS